MTYPTSEPKVMCITSSCRESIPAMFIFKGVLVPRFLANVERWLL